MSEPTFTDEQIKAIREELRSHAIDPPYPAEIRDVLAAALKSPEGWRSRTVSDEERDALAGAIARRCGVYPFEIQADTIKDFYRSDADAAIAVLGLHRSAPKPQDEI